MEEDYTDLAGDSQALEDYTDFARDGEALEADARLVEDFERDMTSGVGGEGLPPDLRQINPITQVVVEPVEPAGGKSKFEQFDVVCGHSDHVYTNKNKPPAEKAPTKLSKLLNKLHVTKSPSSEKRPADAGPSPKWTRRIQQEWRSLQKDLPEEGIFVRVYEERMDLLRAAIVGPAGTPYHDGLFFFDIYFPPNYPNVPPETWYKSYGIRMHPNLYKNGYVCLSLLGTWFGRGCERWNPGKSTVLQLLVSLQALVFNSQPYFDEPVLSGHLPWSKALSLYYNDTVFLESLRTMTWVLHSPPGHFKSLVVSHFRSRGRAILLACKAYSEGGMIGSEDPSRCRKKKGNISSRELRSKLKPLFDKLLKEFNAIGADCEGISVA